MPKSLLTTSSLQMSYLITPGSHKFPSIAKILSTLDPCPSKTIIFFSTCAAVEYFQHTIASVMPRRDDQPFKIVPLHGKQSSKTRLKNFKAFAEASTPSILLTTDLAARGLDIPQVDLVLQPDPPSDPKVFLHRCTSNCIFSVFHSTIQTCLNLNIFLSDSNTSRWANRKSRPQRPEHCLPPPRSGRGLHPISGSPQDAGDSIHDAHHHR